MPCTIVAGRSLPYTDNAVTRWALFVRNKSMGYYYTHSVVSLFPSYISQCGAAFVF